MKSGNHDKRVYLWTILITVYKNIFWVPLDVDKRSQSLASKDTHLVFSISRASLAISKSALKVMPGKLDIKRHSASILYISESLSM